MSKWKQAHAYGEYPYLRREIPNSNYYVDLVWDINCSKWELRFYNVYEDDCQFWRYIEVPKEAVRQACAKAQFIIMGYLADQQRIWSAMLSEWNDLEEEDEEVEVLD